MRQGINLIIGDNASGKTTILRGMRIALSSFFTGFSDENTKTTGIVNGDFTRLYHNGQQALIRPVKICFDIDNYKNLYIERLGLKKKTLYKGVKEYKNNAFLLYLQRTFTNESQIPLPLFASFSTEDIHSTRKLSVKDFKRYQLPPSFGYYECLYGDGFLDYWIKRLLVLEEGATDKTEIAIIRNAVKTSLGEEGCNVIEDISVRPNQGKVYFCLKDGREIESDDLSDGYKRLANIVIDLAFRCAFLNRSVYGMQTCEQTAGTVLIDEIDEHLHPSLQSVVLSALQRAFPRVQFIVTTHAPMVMTGVTDIPENQVLKLDYRDGKYVSTPISTYGLDASTILELYMHQVSRIQKVNDELKRLFELIDAEQIEEARQLQKKLANQFDDRLPELAEAQAMLTLYD